MFVNKESNLNSNTVAAFNNDNNNNNNYIHNYYVHNYLATSSFADHIHSEIFASTIVDIL